MDCMRNKYHIIFNLFLSFFALDKRSDASTSTGDSKARS